MNLNSLYKILLKILLIVSWTKLRTFDVPFLLSENYENAMSEKRGSGMKRVVLEFV